MYARVEDRSMPTSHARLFGHLCRLMSPAADIDADADLLGRYIRQRDDDAFAAIVRRHGPMVLNVCHRVIGDAHAAEDAFQATFLTLAKQAGAIRRPVALAAWLHGTARHIALNVRTAAGRRRSVSLPPDAKSPADPQPDPLTQLTARESLLTVDEEVQGLPEVYRLAVVLCCLEGKSLNKAARHLGCTTGSLRGRLERGRKRLHDRLVRRGLTLSAAVAAALVARGNLAAANVSPGLADATVKAALAFAGVSQSAAPRASIEAARLAAEVLRGAWVGKLKLALVLVLGVGLATVGIAALSQSPAGEKPGNTPKQLVAKAEQSKHEEPKQVRKDTLGDPLPDGVLARLGSVQLRHARASLLAFSADGKTLTSAGEDESVRVWDVAAGRLLRRLPGPPWNFHIRAHSANGATLAAGGTAPGIALWDVASGKERRLPFEGDDPHPLGFSADGRTLAVAQKSAVHLLDVTSGRELVLPLAHKQHVSCLVFSRDGKIVATADGSRPDRVRLWDVATGKETGLTQAEVQTLVFSPDGRTLAIAGTKKVRLWDLTGKEQAVLNIPPRDTNLYGCPQVAFSPEGKILAAGGDGRPLVLWDVAAQKELRRLHAGWLTGNILFAPDGRILATTTHNVIRLWDVATGSERHPRDGHSGEVNSVAFSPDSRLVVSGSYNDRTVRLWDAATGRQKDVLAGHRDDVWKVGFGPNQMVVSGGEDGTVRLGEAASGKQLRTFSLGGPEAADRQPVNLLRLSSDGKTLAAIGRGHKKPTEFVLWAWDVASGRELARRRISAAGNWWEFCLSLDTKVVALVAGGRLTLEGVTTGASRELPAVANAEGPLAFAPEGKSLAVRVVVSGRWDDEAGRVAVLDLTEDARTPLTLESGLTGMAAFSPDGRYLATAGLNHVSLWELASGRAVLRRDRPEPFHGVFGPSFCSSLDFAPDGGSVATGLPDGTVLIWGLDPAGPATGKHARDSGSDALRLLWDDLAGADAAHAYAAIWTLARVPAVDAVAFLRKRLSPAKGPDSAQLQQLLRELGSDAFPERQAAIEELDRLAEDIRPALRKAVAANPPLETRRRLQQLLARAAAIGPGDRLRGVRAVEVLERIGTPESRQMLQALADGTPGAGLTQEAIAALDRLAKRKTGLAGG